MAVLPTVGVKYRKDVPWMKLIRPEVLGGLGLSEITDPATASVGVTSRSPARTPSSPVRYRIMFVALNVFFGAFQG